MGTYEIRFFCLILMIKYTSKKKKKKKKMDVKDQLLVISVK